MARPASRMSHGSRSSSRTGTSVGTSQSQVGDALADNDGASAAAGHHGYSDMAIPPVLVKLVQQLHQGIFNLLFALQRRSKGVESPFWVILLEMFELLQLLSFPFKRAAQFAWNTDQTMWFIQFVNGSVPETLILGNSTIFYIVIVLLGAVLLDAFVVGYYFSQNQFKYVWTLRYMRLICTLFMTILYIPVIALFTSMLIGCETPSGNIVSCWTGTMAVRSAVVIVVSIIFVALSLTFALSVFQQDPTDQSEILGRPHSRIEVYQLIMKTLLTVTFVLIEHHRELHWILVGLCLFASITSFFLYSWFIPFYRWRFMVLRVASQGLFVWASFCLLFVTAIDDDVNNSITIMFFFVTPCILLLSTYAVSSRRNWIKSAKITPNSSPYTVELMARYMLEDCGLLFKSREAPPTPEAGAVEDGHKNEEMLRQITELYSEAAEVNNSSSILYMFWANFSLYHCSNKQRSLVLLAECLKRSPAIDENFVVFRQRKMMNEESSSDNTDMLEFIICEAHMKKASKHERRAVAYQTRFWAELMKDRADLQKLFLLGSTVNSEVTLADANYSKAIQSSSKSSGVLRSYSKFLLDVCNDAQKSEDLAERARHLDELRRRQVGSGDGVIDVSNIISNGAADTDSAIFTINNAGIIINVNAGVRNLFGFEKPQQLVGQNISVLVPPPFDKLHDNFLSSYMNRGEGQIIGKLRKIFALRSDQYLMPIMLLVRQLTFGTSATFLGVFKAVPEGVATNEYILLDVAGNIKAFTPRCTEFFGGTPAEIERYQMHITDWIENFDEVSHLMLEHNGYHVQLQVQDQIINLTCMLISTVISGQPIKIIKLVEDSAADAHPAPPLNDAMGQIRKEMPMNFYLDESVIKKEKGKRSGAVADKADVAKELELKKTAEKAKRRDVSGLSVRKARRSRRNSVAHSVTAGSDVSDNDSAKPSIDQAAVAPQREYSSSVNGSEKASTHKTGTSQGSTTVNRLMRVSFAKKIEATSSRLRITRKGIWALFMLMIAVSIAVSWYTSYIYSVHLTTMDHLSDTSRNYADAAILVQKVAKLFDPSANNTDLAALQEEVLSISQSLSDTHFSTFTEASYLAPQDYVRFTDNSLNITVNVIAGGVQVTTKMSMNDAVKELSTRASLLATRQQRNDSMDWQTEVDILGNLALNTLEEPFDELIHIFLAAYTNNITTYKGKLYAISLTPIVIIYAVMIILIAATLVKTNSDAKVVYRLFLEIPKVEIRNMYNKCVQKISTIDGAPEASVDGDKRGDTSNIFDFDNFLGQGAKSNENELGSGGDSSDKMRNLQQIAKRVALFCLMTAAFFVAYSVSTVNFLQQTSEYGSQIAWSAKVHRLSQKTNYEVNNLYSTGALLGSFADRRARLNSTLSNLDMYAANFLSGVPEFGLPDYFQTVKPVLSGFPTPADTLDLIFDSPNSYRIPNDECVQVAYGSLNHGVYNAVQQFVETAYDVVGAVDSVSTSSTTGKTMYRNFYATQSLDTMSLCLPTMMGYFINYFMEPTRQFAAVVSDISQPIVNSVLCIALLLLFFLSLDPMMKSIEKEVALTPSMLMMLPVNVLMKVESIRKFTQDANNK